MANRANPGQRDRFVVLAGIDTHVIQKREQRMFHSNCGLPPVALAEIRICQAYVRFMVELLRRNPECFEFAKELFIIE